MIIGKNICIFYQLLGDIKLYQFYNYGLCGEPFPGQLCPSGSNI